MSRINCEHCKALVTPGASFCLACFMPFDDEPAAPAAPTAPPEQPSGYGFPPGQPAAPPYGSPPGQPAAPPYGGQPYGGQPYGSPAPQPAYAGSTGAAGGGDFFAAPPPTQFQHHPGQGVDWRVNAPQAALLGATRAKQQSRVPTVVASVVGVLVLVGVLFGAKALFAGQSEKEKFATAFREARPPDMLPALPDITSMTSGSLDEEPEAPGQAKAYVESIDAKVRAGNDAIFAMQDTMDRWADGEVSDDELRTAIQQFDRKLSATASSDALFEAPQSTRRGLGKLTESITEYKMAMHALLDWLDSQSGGSRMTFRLMIGSANVHWDEGIVNLYRAGQTKAPPLPHPQPKK